MAKQIAFTKYEAALLLDAYLKVLSGKLSRMDSIKECSRALRLMAINAGMEIDEIYRNENGISFQMASMESAYQDKTIRKPATRLFTETVKLYKNDRKAYQNLLKEAKDMADTKQNNEANFMSWLSKKVSSTQLSELHMALIEIEQQAKKTKLFEGSIYDNLEPSMIRRVKADIVRSKTFGFTHRKQWGTILSALSYLLKYANKKNTEAVNISQSQMQMHSKLVSAQPASANDSEKNISTGTRREVDKSAFDDIVTAIREKSLQQEQSARQHNHDGEAFYRWLKDDQNMAEATCRSYVAAIRSAERFAIERDIAKKRVYTSDLAEAKATADALFADPEFIQYNNDQHNRFRSAITKLFIFYRSNWKPAEETVTICQQKREPLVETTQYITILIEHFSKGYRLESALDMKRLRRYYKELTGSALTIEQPKVESAIRDCGIVYDGRLYMPQTMLSAEMKDQILSFIERCFDEGRVAVYYEALFREFSDELLDHHIYNAEMLKAYLAYYVGDKYYVGRSYLSKEMRAEVDPIDEVRQFIKQYDIPLQVDDICSALSHIAKDRVRIILGSNGEFVRNSKGEYFHVDSLDLTDEELENIAAIIDSYIEEQEFISGNELYDAIQNKYPYTFEKNAAFSMIGWRDALKYKLGDRYSFVGNIISRKGKSLSMSDVFTEYGKSRSRFTIEELEQFADSIGTTIYFDALYTYAIRISHQWFTTKGSAHFSVKETDAVLERFCGRNYMPLSSITEFATFPNASYPWTEYLLEQYVAYFSGKFYLLHGNYNKNCAVGAIVKKTCQFNSFDELVTDILAHSDIPLQKKEVLDYLVENGYIARRSYNNIEELLINARAKRNQKEKK